MTLRQIQISAGEDAVSALVAVAEDNGALSVQAFAETGAEGRATVLVLTRPDEHQSLLDALQSELGPENGWRITLTPVETTIPFPNEPEKDEGEEADSSEGEASGDERPPLPSGGRSREEIYDEVHEAAQWGRDYVLFVVLSTVVAVFGMMADNVAVVVGAMVIAPLLGPNLAFAVGVALGDGRLMARAAATSLLGIGLVLALSAAIGWLWPVPLTSHELMSRSEVGFAGMAVALASGAAAALSLVTGLSSALMGVMVAVALLPPAAAVGLFLGGGQPELATGAALLLALNVVCINLAAQVVMVTRGITPRNWYEKQTARRASMVNTAFWMILLAALGGLLWLRAPIAP